MGIVAYLYDRIICMNDKRNTNKSNRTKLLESIRKIVREVIEEKKTDVEKTWAEMMTNLEKEIKKPIKLDDAGNYNVCDCEPHHISIRPVVHDIFDLQY